MKLSCEKDSQKSDFSRVFNIKKNILFISHLADVFLNILPLVLKICRLIESLLGRHKLDYINRMIQLTDDFCLLLRYDGTSSF